MLNKAMIIGHLGKDPELSFTKSGKPVCNFSVATDESWTDDQGVKQKATEWHAITVWGPQGENCKKYLSKGSKVFVEGKIATRSWDDKDGHKHYKTEIIALNVRFLDSKGSGDRPPAHDDKDAPRSGGRPQQQGLPMEEDFRPPANDDGWF